MPIGDYENRKITEVAAFTEAFEVLAKQNRSANEKFNEFLEHFTGASKLALIKALKFKGISLNYGMSKNVISIGYPIKYIKLNTKLIDICKKITSKEWTDADKIDYKFKLSFIGE